MKSINIFFNFKSVIAKGLLNRIQESAGYIPVYLNFSAQTSSARTQEIIESKLERKRKNILGKKLFRKPIICINSGHNKVTVEYFRQCIYKGVSWSGLCCYYKIPEMDFFLRRKLYLAPNCEVQEHGINVGFW